MNYAAAAWTEQHCGHKYTTAKVLGVIVGHVGIHSGDRTAYPSVPRIAKLIGATDRTVQRAIKALAADGLEVGYGEGPTGPTGPTNLYTVPDRFSWAKISEAIRDEGSLNPRGDILSPEEIYIKNVSFSEKESKHREQLRGDKMSPLAKRRRRTRPEPEQVAPAPVRELAVCAYEPCQQMTTGGFCSSDCTLSAEIPGWAAGWHDRHPGQAATTSDTDSSLSLRERLQVRREQRHSELSSVG